MFCLILLLKLFLDLVGSEKGEMCAMKEARLLPDVDMRQGARILEKVGFQATIYEEDCFFARCMRIAYLFCIS